MATTVMACQPLAPRVPQPGMPLLSGDTPQDAGALIAMPHEHPQPADGVAVMQQDVTAERQIKDSLRASESMFREMAESIRDAFFLIRAHDAQILYVSPAYEAIWGRSCDSLRANPRAFIDAVHDDDRERIVKNCRSGAASGQFDQEFRILRSDGAQRWVRVRCYPIHDETGALQRISGIAVDITARKEAQVRIAYLNRVCTMLSGINTLIVRAGNREELFSEACRIAVDAGGFRMVWLGILDRSTMKLVSVASAGANEGLLSNLKEHFAASANATIGNSGSAIALREKTAAVSNDAQNDPKVLFGKKYAESGVRSVAMLPLVVAGEAVGVLGLYAGEIEFFHAEEMKLLAELAGDIAFAIAHIDKEEKLARLSRVQAVTSAINSLIVRVSDRQELYAEVCRIAVEHGNFCTAWIGTFDSALHEVTQVARASAGAELSSIQTEFTWKVDVANGLGVGDRAIREMRPAFDNDIAAGSTVLNERRLEAIRGGSRSIIALPFIVGDAVAGHLSLYSKEADFFTEAEVKLLAELAGNISFALEHIERQEKIAKLSRIRAVSGGINAAIVRLREREALLQEVCSIAVKAGKFELVWIAEIDQAAEQARPLAWAGFPPEVANAVAWKAITGARTALCESLRTRRLAVRTGIAADAAAGILREEAVKQGCRSAVCLPLVVDDDVVAAILLYAPGINFFDRQELALLSEVAADISFALQAIARREQLDYVAYYDVLTGLANRSLFFERVAQYMRGAVAGGHKLAVCLIDLQRFKNFNESFGPSAGDALLRQVADWLTRNVGDVNLLARMGADHFAVVMPQVAQEGDVARMLEKLMESFAEHPFCVNDADFRLAAKAGVALFPDDGSNAYTLFNNAEAALKKAKAGGDRYLFYTPKMTAVAAGKLTLETQLRQALDREEFVLHYQPKVDLASGKLTSAEALIRWNNPRTGLVPPMQFIPILEETGLINDVGRWALRTAIAEYLRWRAAGLPAVRVAVNVSPLQLRDRGFIDEIRRIVGIDAHAAAGLELEITESVIMDDVKHNIATLRAIRETGVTIAIDDFGTGFSSLSYLARLPVDTLKIDRSFIVDMTAAPEGLALVSTIISLAHALKLKVVAEGVETEEQSRLLRLLSCDEMQGYLFSKPVPADVFEAKFLPRDVNERGRD